jgi:hypothetical protein
LFSQFKKYKFLAPKGVNQKNIFCKEGIPKEFFAEIKQK